MADFITLPVIAAGAILGTLAFVFHQKKKKPAEKTSDAETAVQGIPAGLEDVYSYGVDPCGSGKPVMYTLHTCRHCVHLKNFLDKNDIEHHLVFVDDFQDPARREIMSVMRTFNPRGSFPTFVVPDGRSAVGFRENQVRELLGLKD
ncbi:MAG: glutaredoxin family protein [Mailhella sp.]|nr:glutaredoxin family protein [Mailhella sp.]